MALARGAPAAFNAATTFALSSARRSRRRDGDADRRHARRVGHGGECRGLRKGARGVRPPSCRRRSISGRSTFCRRAPIRSSGRRISTASRSTLVGFVPNEIVHDTLVATLRATLPGMPDRRRRRDRLRRAAGFRRGGELCHRRAGAPQHAAASPSTVLRSTSSGDARSVDDYEALLASLDGPVSEGHDRGRRRRHAGGGLALWLAGREGRAARWCSPATFRRPRRATTWRRRRGSLFAGSTIEDRVRVAAGEPRMDWIGAIKFAMGELAKLERRHACRSATRPTRSRARR